MIPGRNVHFRLTKEIYLFNWLNQGFLSNSSKAGAYHEGTFLCLDALRENYPGDNWPSTKDLMLIVSKTPFPGSIEGPMFTASKEVLMLLGMETEKSWEMDDGIKVYWAAEVFE